MACVKNVSKIDTGCLSKCDGLFITGINKEEFDQEQVKEILSKVETQYESYKLGGEQPILPSFVEGKECCC